MSKQIVSGENIARVTAIDAGCVICILGSVEPGEQASVYADSISTKQVSPAKGKLNLTWRPMYNASEVTGTVNILTTDDGTTNTLHYDADNNLLKLTDGTNTSQIACTPVADTVYSIICNWDKIGGLQIGLDGVCGTSVDFAGRFPTEDEMSFAWQADAPQYVKMVNFEEAV